jgi:hypothetical protein
MNLLSIVISFLLGETQLVVTVLDQKNIFNKRPEESYRILLGTQALSCGVDWELK